jgi:DNA repair exonuclease SbcCD nuclease subunit
MLVALLGDTHFIASKSSPILATYFKKFYKYFFDYLDKNNIKTIIQTGDMFDQRKDVHFHTIKWTNENFFAPIDDQNISLYAISGNHDSVFKNTNEINSVRLLCPKDTVVVDMLPKTILLGSAEFDLYPWINVENFEASLEFAKKSTSEYAVGHFEFANFPMHPGTIAETGMNHSLFSNYEQVFSGHYHCVSERDNVLYTGTPCELTWSDCDDPKGFWVLDTETGKREYIRNPYTLFEKISYVDGISYDFTRVKEKYIKIVVVSKTDQKAFDKFLDNVNHNQPHDVKIIESSIVTSVADAIDVTTLETTHSMISNVIDNLDTSVDKVKLKHRILELYAEAMQTT